MSICNRIGFGCLSLAAVLVAGATAAQQLDLAASLKEVAPQFPASENRTAIVKELLVEYVDPPEPGDPPRPVVPLQVVGRTRATALLNILYTEAALDSSSWRRAVLQFAASRASEKGAALQMLYAHIGTIARVNAYARIRPGELGEYEPPPEGAIRTDEMILTLSIVEAGAAANDGEARALLKKMASSNPHEPVREAAQQALAEAP